jgi:uncharacterized protein
VLVNPWVRDVLDSFRAGLTVGEFLARDAAQGRDFAEVVSVVGFLEEQGFLRMRPDPPQYGVSKEEYQSIPSQFSVWLSINNSCNLGCSYCFVEEMSQDRQLMEHDTLELSARRIAETAKANKTREVVVKFAGGEPTLAIDSMEFAYDLIRSELEGTDTKLQFAVLSNGTAINERIIAFLKRPGVGIGISVDGYGEYHDVHRTYKHDGSGSWETIVRNVARLKAEGIQPYIMATVTKESAPGVRKLAEWIFTEGLATRLNVVRSRYKAAEGPSPIEIRAGRKHLNIVGTHKYTVAETQAERDADYAAIVQACTKGFEEVFQFLEANPGLVDVASQLHICELSFDNPLNGAACGIGRSHVVFDYKGKLTDCVMTLHEAETPATDNLLKDVPHTVQHMPYDEASVAGQSDCHSCEWYPVCGGGCPTANSRVNGHPYTRSPLCEFYKYVIPRYLDCLGQNMMARKAGKGRVDGPEQESQHVTQ